jgi:hypothetical protein
MLVIRMFVTKIHNRMLITIRTMEEGTTEVSAQTTEDVVRTFEATVAILGAVMIL